MTLIGDFLGRLFDVIQGLYAFLSEVLFHQLGDSNMYVIDLFTVAGVGIVISVWIIKNIVEVFI